jgi:class 3 adenylate cyclase/pimeloyl-ACP methyl ester carboxylesterase
MIDAPEVGYVRSGDVSIAYHVVGDGPIDIIYVAEFWNSIEVQWEQPAYARFLRGLASIGRLICFDQRGSGLSDPVALDRLPTLEVWIDDIRAVMEAVSSRRVALVCSGGGGFMGITFAATHPDVVSSLVLLNGMARLSRADDYPWGTSPEFEDRVRRETESGWGRGAFLEIVAPSMVSNEGFRAWWGRYQRVGSSLGTQLAQRAMLLELDVRHVLGSIRVPTLVIHRAGNRLVVVEHGRYLAEHIPGAKLVEIPGVDYFLFLDGADQVLGEIEGFLGRPQRPLEQDRVLATVMFTDIAGSTERVAAIGDRAWGELLGAFRAAVRRELERFRGREVDTAGDGFLAIFDGPARAVRCALAIAESTRQLGVEVRSGLHTGEVEMSGEKASGIALHVGARVASEAPPGQVLVSSTVKDLVAGSGLVFEDRGLHELKGVPEPRRLFAVVDDRWT